MAQAIITAGAAPIFLTKNYLNRDAVVAVSTGDAFKHRAYDMTRTSKWVSLGSDDSTTETYDARLFEGSAQSTRAVDFVALLGINLKNFKLEYSSNDGSTWATLGTDYSVGVNNFTGEDHIITLVTAVDINRIKLTAYKTQTADQDKEVGELLVCALRLQPTSGLFRYKKSFRDNVKSIQMADGTLDYTYVFRSDDSFEIYGASVEWRGISQAQRDLMRAIKASPEPFVWYPEPGDVKADAFLCRIVPDSYDEEYVSKYRGAGYAISFSVEEIGGG